MRFQVQSQRSFILGNLTELIHSFSQQEKVGYSQIIEFSLAELVRQSMRSIAQQGDNLGEQRLLEQAIHQTEQQVQEGLDTSVEFDFAPYRASLQPALKYAAREMAELDGRLRRSRQQERTSQKEQLNSEAGVPFELIEVGLPNAIEALMTIPLLETVGLDLGQVGESYEIEGDWFPFQLAVGELRLTIQEDGQLYTCTYHFPQTLRASACELVVTVARQIYIR